MLDVVARHAQARSDMVKWTAPKIIWRAGGTETRHTYETSGITARWIVPALAEQWWTSPGDNSAHEQALERLEFQIIIEQPSDLAGTYPVTVEMEPRFTVGKRKDQST